MKEKIIIVSKYTVKIVAFLVLLVLLNKGLAYLVVDDYDHHRSRMHEFYEIEEDLDVLFLGSSHSYCSIYTDMFEQLTDTNAFNAASGTQRIDVSYALLKEYAKEHSVKTVYLELYYNAMDKSDYIDRTSISPVYRATDYMPFSWNKLNLLMNASSPEYYINSFVSAKRYWKYLFQPSELIETYTTKQSVEYQNFAYKTETREYIGKGFLTSFTVLAEYVAVDNTDFSAYIPSDDWLNTFYEMYEYCQANDIELILYSAAMPVETLASGDYDIYINQVYSIIEGTDLTYIDFNLAKAELLVTEPSDFFDSNHLNYYGAQKFTEAFYQVYYELENPEDYFYDSFYEKLEDMYPEYLEEATE